MLEAKAPLEVLMFHRFITTLGVSLLTLPQTPAIAQMPIPIQEQSLAEGECSQGIELNQARLLLELDPQNGKLQGRYTATLQNPFSQPLAQACFVLNPGLKVERIEMSGLNSILKEPIDGDNPLAYRLIPQQPIAPGASQQLSMNFSGQIQSQAKFGRIQPDDVFLTAQSFYYPRFERAHRRYCPLDVHVKLPQGYLPVLSGTLQTPILSGETHQSNLETVCGFKNEHGFDLAAARYAVGGSGNIRVYHRPGKQMPAAELKTIAQELSETLAALKTQFGPHTASSFSLVETNREDLGGMGKANTVFLSDKYFGRPETAAPQQYVHFKQKFKDEAQVAEELAFYRRTVIAHEAAHLFVNHFYDYDKPWFAEGLPEFASLGVLETLGRKAYLERKLVDYRRLWQQIPNRPLPALNQAGLNSQLGYLANYQGTPLALWGLWQARGEGFWPSWKAWLAQRDRPLNYAGFKAHFKLNEAESARFEKGFEPEGL